MSTSFSFFILYIFHLSLLSRLTSGIKFEDIIICGGSIIKVFPFPYIALNTNPSFKSSITHISSIYESCLDFVRVRSIIYISYDNIFIKLLLNCCADPYDSLATLSGCLKYKYLKNVLFPVHPSSS